ncbi:MAG TPA: Hsp20/alpha crystallin family protein [Candidatus Paceibacterota bacterium]|nr:Hsp20/alpha crystallin family protein [Candidatus Paceibacterota bacterium]
MRDVEEKFFEDLANYEEQSTPSRAPEPPSYTVELAKANAAPVRARTLSVRHEQPQPQPMEEELSNEPEGQLTIDVYQTPNDIVIESAIAGVRPEDIDINVTNDSITIRGQRHRESRVSDEDYFYQECYWGRFSRSVILPQEVDPDSATVNFKNGILTVRMPKLNRKKERKLRVRLE